MITAIHKRLEQRDEGFTLIELLVVVIIIGILAAIAIPTFLRQRERGWNAASEAEARNVAIAQESWATGNNGIYANDVATLEGEGYVRSQPFQTPGTVSVNLNTAGTAYCVQVSHSSQPAVTYGLSNATGAPARGTCADGTFTATPATPATP